MEIVFRTVKLQKIFNSEKELRKTYGDENARAIMRRMAVLASATNLSQVSRLPPERCHELTGSRSGEFAVDVKQPYRLIFVPDYDSIPRKSDGGIDLAAVTRIKVLTVEDYH